MHAHPHGPELPASTEVEIPSDEVSLRGDLVVPLVSHGIVVFAHGSGSSRSSPRNRAVADSLAYDGFATLLFDLLTADEEAVDRATAAHRFDISLLATRLADAVDWVAHEPRTAALPIGLFGASTGAAAALVVAADRDDVAAVVSRGGRPDLAGQSLAEVTCPTLFIVGGADVEVLELNRRAMQWMSAPVNLHVVPGATHLFAEPGALRAVIDAAGAWFARHLGTGGST